jgi:hypothetical protein
MKYSACPRIHSILWSSAPFILLDETPTEYRTETFLRCDAERTKLTFPLYVRMVAVGSFSTLPADVFELRRRYVILYIVRLKLKNALALDIKN